MFSNRPVYLSCLSTVLVLLFTQVSCTTSPRIYFAKSNAAEGLAYDTFVVLPLSAKDSILSEVTSDNLLAALKSILENRGYENSEYNQADFIIGVRTEHKPRKVAVVEGPTSTRTGTESNLKIRETHEMIDWDNVDKWSLILEIFDNRTKELVWSGWGEIGDPIHFRKEGNQIATVDRILESFPN